MTDHRLHSVVAAEALSWFVRNRGSVLSAEERNTFSAWLKSSPLHVEEFLRTAVMSQNLHAAIETMSIDVDALVAEACADDDHTVVPLRLPVSSGSAAERRWRFRLRRAAIAAAVVFVALAAVIWMQRDGQRFDLPKEFETAHGEQRSWLLPDGSGLDLNSDSAVVVHYSRRERVVEVERGQALFQVAHESARRFRVVAGKTSVIAVGTEFDVQHNAGATVVTVVQGTVAVFTDDVPPSSTVRAALPAQTLSVSAGQQVRINNHLPHLKAAVSVVPNPEQTVAWVQHEIAFDRQPLGDVAAEFSRYSSVPIIIQSSRLRAVPISGVLNEFDTDSFLAFIVKLDGVEIERRSDRILVIDRSK